MDKNVILRKLPRVDDLLKEESLRELCMIYGKKEVLRAVREELDCLRRKILSEPWSNVSRDEAGETAEYDGMKNLIPSGLIPSAEKIAEQAALRLEEESQLSLRRVFNATGIILHTNLGRAPLGKRQMAAVLDAMSGYSNLEYNLSEGKRGKRQEHYAKLISRVTGAEAAVAVNNNAAAVTLILSAPCQRKRSDCFPAGN